MVIKLCFDMSSARKGQSTLNQQNATPWGVVRLECRQNLAKMPL
jgi:hypothetical protein